MYYLSRAQIITRNQLTVERHGGNFVPPENLLNAEPLDYLVETVQASMFGQPLYPTVADKAALYMFNIISNHVFQDGNKRTGLAIMLVFIELNGWKLIDELTPVPFDVEELGSGNSQRDEIYRLTVAVASGLMNLDECRTWFAANTQARD